MDTAAALWYVAASRIPEAIASGTDTPFSPVLGRPSGGRGRPREEGLVIVQIFVRDNNVDQALKALKKKMQREGTFREMKRHVHYEKPSEKRARQEAEAVRRARKLARKRAQREGLLPPPKPKPPRTGTGGPPR